MFDKNGIHVLYLNVQKMDCLWWFDVSKYNFHYSPDGLFLRWLAQMNCVEINIIDTWLTRVIDKIY